MPTDAFAFGHRFAAAADGLHADTPMPHTNRYSVGDNRVDVILDDGGSEYVFVACR